MTPAEASEASGRLTDFDALIARAAATPAEDLRAVVGEYRAAASGAADPRRRAELDLWGDFFREHAHLLARADARWPADRILLQVAVGHGDDSPVTRAAEAWLAGGGCTWVWLRRVPRPERAVPDPQVGEPPKPPPADEVCGTLPIPGDRLLTWSEKGPHRIWSLSTGALLGTLPSEPRARGAFLELPDGPTLLWDTRTGTRLGWIRSARAENPSMFNPVERVIPLAGGGEVVGELREDFDDGVEASWTLRGAIPAEVDMGAASLPSGAVRLAERLLLLWYGDVLWIWEAGSSGPSVLRQHRGVTIGAVPLPGGDFLTFGADGRLTIWDAAARKPRRSLDGHPDAVAGALVRADGTLLSWSRDGTMRLWDLASGGCLASAPESEAAATHPDWVEERRVACPWFQPLHGFAGAGSGHGVDLRRVARTDETLARWHASGRAEVRHLFADGTVVATLEDGQVCVLKLHAGARRIGLAELEGGEGGARR